MTTAINAKPYPYELPENKPCLIIIDMQKDFIDPGGFGEILGNDVSLLSSIIPTTQKLLATFRVLNLPVIHTRECHNPDLSDCPPSKIARGKGALTIGSAGPMGRILIDGEEGNAIIDALKPIAGEYEMTKPGKGAFYNTLLQEILKSLDVSHLVLAGVTTEVCVQTTMREANDRGYECLLVEDCTESYFPEFKKATLEMIVAQAGIVGWTANCEDTITGLKEAYGKII